MGEVGATELPDLCFQGCAVDSYAGYVHECAVTWDVRASGAVEGILYGGRFALLCGLLRLRSQKIRAIASPERFKRTCASYRCDGCRLRTLLSWSKRPSRLPEQRGAFWGEDGDAVFAWRKFAQFRLLRDLVLGAFGVGFFIRGGAILTGFVLFFFTSAIWVAFSHFFISPLWEWLRREYSWERFFLF